MDLTPVKNKKEKNFVLINLIMKYLITTSKNRIFIIINGKFAFKENSQ